MGTSTRTNAQAATKGRKDHWPGSDTMTLSFRPRARPHTVAHDRTAGQVEGEALGDVDLLLLLELLQLVHGLRICIHLREKTHARTKARQGKVS